MKITTIKQHQNKTERYSVFIDNNYAFSMDSADIARYSLLEDSEITEERLRYLMDEVIYRQAKDKALRYLGYSPRTEKEVHEKLYTEGFDFETIQKVIESMESYGYIDDKKYARAYINDRSRLGGYGFIKIKDELKQKGIDSRLINEIWEETEPDEDAVALKLLEKRMRGAAIEDDKEKRKQTDYLLRRGFSYEMARDAIHRHNKLLAE